MIIIIFFYNYCNIHFRFIRVYYLKGGAGVGGAGVGSAENRHRNPHYANKKETIVS